MTLWRGCAGRAVVPWDAEQTHESLKRNLLEECYETLEAIDDGEPMELADELGDILVQVAFHADIARAAGEFDIADVLAAINRKLIRRHPHVFGDGSAPGSPGTINARQVERNWEQLKAEERRQAGKPEPSAMDSVPAALARAIRGPTDPGPGGALRVRLGRCRRGAGQAGGRDWRVSGRYNRSGAAGRVRAMCCSRW